MIIRLTIFGIEVLCLSLGNFILDDEEAEEEAEDEPQLIGGGHTHDFERDPYPLSPDDRYDWEFGFGRTKRVRGKRDQSASD
jgi:hypothetical protein